MTPPVYTDSALLAPDFQSFRRQESIFTALSMVIIAALLLINVVFRRYLYGLSPAVVVTLAAGFAIEAAELIWLQQRAAAPTAATLNFLTWWSIALNSLLVAVLLILTLGEDSQYFVLLAIPVLEAAFRLRLGPALAVVTLAVALNFFGAYGLHSMGEYVEAGASSLIFIMVGAIVWLLINNLRERETALRLNLRELEQTREQLLAEEKLAAVGRLSSAIAHEIRNPVAMISSSLATAQRPGLAETERQEMFAIAASEAQRLAQLSSDFLAYARPRTARTGAVKRRRHAQLRGVGGGPARSGGERADRDRRGPHAGSRLRRAADAAGAVQSGFQRDRRLPAPGPNYAAGGRRKRNDPLRSEQLHRSDRARRHRAPFRAVLHDQARRHGTGSRDRAQHRPRASRRPRAQAQRARLGMLFDRDSGERRRFIRGFGASRWPEY